MDAGSSSTSLLASTEKKRSRCRKTLLRAQPTVFMPSLRISSTNPACFRQTGDRFIPDRSAMDFDVAHYLLTQPRKEKENNEIVSPSKEAYRRILAETFLNNRNRIFAFSKKPPTATEGMLTAALYGADSSKQTKVARTKRYIPQSADKILDAPDLVDDFYLHLLDWGSRNILSIALGNTVYLWNASKGLPSELMTVEDNLGPVTSVNWALDGQRIAIGLNNSDVQLWDSSSGRLLRTLRGVHRERVGTLAWNSNILTTGGMDGKIVNNDMRVRNQVVHIYRGHQGEVCGLKWSGSGKQLASGGDDNLLHIWDLSMASSNQASSENQWLHRFEGHNAAVKALAWCPFQSNLLASGGGGMDQCIKFWNTLTGACLNSIDTGSQVCGLLWNRNERELLSSHGFAGNQLTLWKYPSMVEIADLLGHTSRVLYMAQSPDGCTVATAAGDETLRFWNVFGNPKSASSERFANYSRIR